MNRSEFLFSVMQFPLAGNILSGDKTRSRFVSKFSYPLEAICKYDASYVTHITTKKANQARITIEGRCIYQNTETGIIQDYFKFASCKAENTYAKKDLFMEPNYDFSGVYNEENYIIFRSRQFHEQNYAERGNSKERFDSIKVELQQEKKVKKLKDIQQIVDQTLKGSKLVGRTSFKISNTEKVIIEYPIKTINVNDIEWIFQVDTGPLAIPHPKKQGMSILDSIELAFVAYNQFDTAYLIFNSPTTIEGLTDVKSNHYSEIVELKDVVNEIYTVG